MSNQLDMYEVRVLPYNYAGEHNGVERTYQVTVRVNGETISAMRSMPSEVPPYMTELDVLTRMTAGIISELREKDKQP